MRPGWIVRSCGESLMASLGKAGKVSRLGHVSSSFSSEKWGTRLHNLTAPREVTEFLGERSRKIMSALHAACESNPEPSYTLLGLLSNALGVQQNCNRHATVKSHRLLTTPVSESGLIRSRMPLPDAWLQECSKGSSRALLLLQWAASPTRMQSRPSGLNTASMPEKARRFGTMPPTDGVMHDALERLEFPDGKASSGPMLSRQAHGHCVLVARDSASGAGKLPVAVVAVRTCEIWISGKCKLNYLH